MTDQRIEWLLSGDVSIEYQTRKYLLGQSEPELSSLRARIAREGFGKAFLDARLPSGHWGRDFYQVKWVSSHYTLLDLRYLEAEPVREIRETLDLILSKCKMADGSINESHLVKPGDICINGMFLNYAAFFKVSEPELRSVIDYLLENILPDGGFNCSWKRTGAVHSSMHTTLSVLEGFNEFRKAGCSHRLAEIEKAQAAAQEFLLKHHLFKSDHTGETISKQWTMLSYPPRWHYDILKALVYFADAEVPYDPRLADALDVLKKKMNRRGTWPVQSKHSGEVHFDMETTGRESRWNTLRALRVLNFYPDK